MEHILRIARYFRGIFFEQCRENLAIRLLHNNFLVIRNHILIFYKGEKMSMHYFRVQLCVPKVEGWAVLPHAQWFAHEAQVHRGRDYAAIVGEFDLRHRLPATTSNFGVYYMRKFHEYNILIPYFLKPEKFCNIRQHLLGFQIQSSVAHLDSNLNQQDQWIQIQIQIQIQNQTNTVP